jgi:hypothetical protein
MESSHASVLRNAPHTGDTKQVTVDAHLDLVGANARELEAHHDGLLGLVDVDGRLPAVAAQPIGKLAE